MIEPLEPRRHFNGTLYVTINKAAVTVRGTDAADSVFIGGTADSHGDPDYGYTLSADVGISLFVNGQPYEGSLTFDYGSRNWYKPLRVDLGAGDDLITAQHFPGISSATYKLGDGNDRVKAYQSSGLLAVDGGLGDDDIGISMSQDFNIANIAVYSGYGRDRVYVGGFVEYDSDGMGGNLLIDDAKGPTNIAINGLRVKSETSIRTRGNSTDHVKLSGCRFWRPPAIYTAGGVDTITAEAGTSFKRGVSVKTDGDNDDVTGF